MISTDEVQSDDLLERTNGSEGMKDLRDVPRERMTEVREFTLSATSDNNYKGLWLKE